VPAIVADRRSEQQQREHPRLGWRLVAERGDVRPAQLSLGGPACTIGRAADNAIVIVHDGVSRHHATIVRDGDSFRLSDAGSRNGTYVNGTRLRGSHYLAHGDLIGLGGPNPHLRFVDEHVLDEPLHSGPTVRDNRPRLNYDDRRLRFSVHGTPLDLSQDEFSLLRYLFESEGEICSRPDCAAAIWGVAAPRHEDDLDHVVDRLRRKLQRLDPRFDVVRTRITGGLILQV
jgi:hypothetical protein